MEVTDQDFTVCFLYDQLRVEIIRCLNDYIDNRRGSIAELKERFRRSLPEAARRRVRSVKQLVDALEKQGVIGDNNVKIIKMLAEKLELEELIKKVEEFERDVSGRVQRTLDAATKAPAVIWEIFKGGVQTSVIHLKAVLSCRGVQVTIAAATLLSIYGMNPEALKNLQPFLDLGAQLVTLVRGSVVFVLKISSIASLKRLRKGYKDGSLKKSMKKALNEMKELKELSKGEEIDVEVTIDEEEYHEVFWNLILSEEKANNVSKDQSTRDAEKRRRHSICCERDVPKENSKPLGMTQIQIRVGRHVSELDKVIDYLKASELDQVTRFEDMRIARIIELQKERLMDVRREISEMKIFLAASRVSQIRVEEGFEGHLKDLPKGEVPQIRVPFPDPVSSYSVASAGERISSSWQDEKGVSGLSEIQVKRVREVSQESGWGSGSTSSQEETEEESGSVQHKMRQDKCLLLRRQLPNFEDDVIATELLDSLPCLTEEQKDQITDDEKNYLPSKAVRTLVEKLEEHEEGFEQLVRALLIADLGHVAVLLDPNFSYDTAVQNELYDQKEKFRCLITDAVGVDVPVFIRIIDYEEYYGERRLHVEDQIASTFSKSYSLESKNLRWLLSKVLPRGVFFVCTKQLSSSKVQTSKGSEVPSVLTKRKDSVIILLRMAKVEALEKLWEIYETEELLILRQGFLSYSLIFEKNIRRLNEKMAFEILFREDDYLEKLHFLRKGDEIPRFSTYNLCRELKLREYQKELAAPALEGNNTIICAPTNSGKTFVAMEIAKRHLDAYKGRNEVQRPQVIFVVSKVNLVFKQRVRLEEYLTNYSISDISGNNSDVLPLHRLMQDNDVVVLTAQILVNALTDKSVNISDISLLVFDECHHANKEHPYNKIMQEYLDVKINGSEPKRLPQVIGLTASLGVKQTSKEEKAKEHVLRMCANLDASNISTVREHEEELGKAAITGNVHDCKSIQVHKEPDIFEQEINKTMEDIEAFIKTSSSFDPPKATDRQAESYRQWIEALENNASTTENNDQFVCAQRLRRYHEALLINSNVRIEDAILHLEDYFFNTLDKSKFTETESWLQKTFLKAKEHIDGHHREVNIPQNPLLLKLQEQIKEFHAKTPEDCQAKGILFTRTRDYACALKRWMEETVELKDILKPEVLLGSAALTQNQQEQVIQRFKKGSTNIIIATTVAEEGLDIPTCNYVIRYGVKGNEIAYVQSRARIRAEEGKYVHLSDAKSRGEEHERRNEYRELLLTFAVTEAQNMDKEDFLKKINTLQASSIRAVKRKRQLQEEKKLQLKYVDQGVTFYCKKCNALVCHAQDIRRFAETHHVVINRDIYERIDIKPHPKPSTFDNVYFGKKILCKKCGYDWGVIITVEDTEWPCLKVVSFVTTLDHGKQRKLFKKWKDLPFKIREATLEEMMEDLQNDVK